MCLLAEACTGHTTTGASTGHRCLRRSTSGLCLLGAFVVLIIFISLSVLHWFDLSFAPGSCSISGTRVDAANSVRSVHRWLFSAGTAPCSSSFGCLAFLASCLSSCTYLMCPFQEGCPPSGPPCCNGLEQLISALTIFLFVLFVRHGSRRGS